MIRDDAHDSGVLAHFEALYGASDDPWRVRESWYEQRKRALLLACLDRPLYRSAYEPGCGNGEMSAALAQRCTRLLAVDGAAGAVAAARARLAGAAHCTVAQARLPADWPDEQFDLIVVSELAYYFAGAPLQAMAAAAARSLAPGGMLVLCHWRNDFDDRASATDTVHALFGAGAQLLPLLRHLERDFLLEAWRKEGSAA
jgi:SAM-dependent methyltransferase